MDYPILKKLQCSGDYSDDLHGYEMYEVPIYDIPINKKNFCKPFTTMEGKAGTKTIALCKNSKDSKTCNICVDTAKQLANMNK